MGSNVYPVTAATVLPKAVNEFTSSGTYTVPTGATWARIIAIGGGGGGGNSTTVGRYSGGGGSGAYVDKWVQVTAGATHTVTIGAGGVSQTTSANGNDGGTTSVGTLVSALGGSGGGGNASAALPASGGAGEKPGNPAVLFYNGTSTSGNNGVGAGGFLGQVSGGASTNGAASGLGYGAGGGGAGNNASAASGAGAIGYAIVYSY